MCAYVGGGLHRGPVEWWKVDVYADWAGIFQPPSVWKTGMVV